MVGKLLVRGMLAGLVAGLVMFGFAKVVGEPQVDRAIAFEQQADAAKGEAPGTGNRKPPHAGRRGSADRCDRLWDSGWRPLLAGVRLCEWPCRQDTCARVVGMARRGGVCRAGVGPRAQISGEPSVCWRSRDYWLSDGALFPDDRDFHLGHGVLDQDSWRTGRAVGRVERVRVERRCVRGHHCGRDGGLAGHRRSAENLPRCAPVEFSRGFARHAAH